MTSWGNTDDAANSVFYAASQFNLVANTSNQTALFGNTTMGAIVSKQIVGQYGVAPAEATSTSGEGKKVTHAGWNLRKVGTGPIATIAITAGGTGYGNTNLVVVSANGTGSVNATAAVTTNSTGGITSLNITNYGLGFFAVNPAVSVTNATGGATGVGTSATFLATATGRAGRVSYETLIAMGSITGDAADDTLLPDS